MPARRCGFRAVDILTGKSMVYVWPSLLPDSGGFLLSGLMAYWATGQVRL